MVEVEIVLKTTLHGDIEFITLSTLGNGADFGDLDQSVTDFCNGNISNSVRGSLWWIQSSNFTNYFL